MCDVSAWSAGGRCRSRVLLVPAAAVAMALAPAGAPAALAALAAQAPAADAYVTEGLARAYSLRQRTIDVALARARGQEARAAALPTVGLSHIGTRSTGNIIDIGRFLNPTYAALNSLLGAPNFPTDLDLRLPLQSQSTLRVTQPLFAPQAWYGAVAASRAADAERFARDGAGRALAAEIRLAWIGWFKAQRVAAIVDDAVRLLDEQVRVSDRLVQEGIRGPDAALQARAELAAVRQERLLAGVQLGAARRQLNHLVARPLDAAITDDSLAPDATLPSADSALRAATAGRTELRGLEAATRAAAAQRRSLQSAYLPTVAVALDHGYQGNRMAFDGDHRYTVLSVLAQWNLFNGTADRARAEAAALQGERLSLRRDEVASLVELEVRTAADAAEAARLAIGAADERLAATQRAFAIVQRRYAEGLAVPIEVLDARRALTTAAVARAAALADFHARRVEFLRAAALDGVPTP